MQNQASLAKVGDAIDYWDKKGYDTWNADLEVHFARVKKGKYASIMDFNTANSETMKEGQCDLALLRKSLMSYYVCIGTQQHSPYKKMISRK